MLKQSAQWLVGKGLINQNQIVDGKGGKFYIRGNIKDAAMLSGDPTTWADSVMLPAIKNSGVLDDAKVAERMRLMSDQEKKRTGVAPNEEALRERAQAGLISDDLYHSGFRGTVIDQIAHAIVNSPLINRDTAAMGKLPAAEIAADVGKNPVAAFAELGSALSNFGDVLASPAIKAAGPVLDSLAHHVADAADALQKWEAAHPQAATAASTGALGAGAAAAGWLGYKMYAGITSLFGGGGAAGGGAAGAASGGAGLGGLFGGLAPFAPLLAGAGVAGSLYAWLKDFRDPGVSDAVLEQSRRSGMVAHPGGFVYDPEAHHGDAMSHLGDQHGPIQVDSTVHGEATISGTIRVEAGSELLRIVNQALNISQQMALNPTASGHSGRMDSDAAPLGHGGIGSR